MHNLVFVVLLSACIENAIVPSRTEPAGALDTSDTAGGWDTPAPDEPREPASGCESFKMSWLAPLAGDLDIQGDFQAANGDTAVPWASWASAAETNRIEATWSVCPGVVSFRGEGVADLDGDGDGDAWSCSLQSSTEGDFALNGDVEFTFDGEPLEVLIAPAPTSEGCEVVAEFGQG